ncbi:hypothetical protein X747_23200 [Mesorhizobium sp. LNJC384A00]|nr:hypothetical protein X765_31210 [Mesorhizobium sp. LSHC440B00]ESX33481.1 hypothetical protein X763_25755 [Mesorhizobium sp. LSHC432A00]ESX80047.1 hypothetical protein X757_04765 [Mesorhizobium sp. LSHC414A00]ESY17033.1 hypothetical protein X749_31180 [Mesorhizobium sp. LNJC391B00]ESY39671.1 hypothetical protein X747_23200 [Mesorhizobium sp. LNJC384A00]
MNRLGAASRYRVQHSSGGTELIDPLPLDGPDYVHGQHAQHGQLALHRAQIATVGLFRLMKTSLCVC